MIIGFSGKIGSGKDYVSKNIFLPLIQKENKVKSLFLSFADPLKQECSVKFGFTYENLYVNKNNFTRKKLQETGDENREKYGTSVYSNAMRTQIKLHGERSDINLFIITDVRFPEEFSFIKENGGKIYRVISEKRTYDKMIKECNGNEEEVKLRSSHISETAIDKEIFDGYIYNDYGENPDEQCKEIVTKLFSPVFRNV